MRRTSDGFTAGVLILFSAYFAAMVWNPPYELHATIHVVPTCLAIGLLAASLKWWRLDATSYLLIVAFLVLHVLGTRYVYTHVPYDRWSVAWVGASVSDLTGWQRNHFDRFVHLMFGVLIAPVAYDVRARSTGLRGAWGYLAAVEFVVAASAVFELLEWIGAVTLAPDYALSYLGQQGDVWDAHKDMGLAFLGALASIACVALMERAAAQRNGTASPVAPYV